MIFGIAPYDNFFNSTAAFGALSALSVLAQESLEAIS